MNYKFTPQYLKNYEINISNLFHQKKIRAPIHLYDGNEKPIIKIFKKIKKKDKINIPLKFKEYRYLFNERTLNRINCVILPMEALLKAFKIRI